MVLDARCVANGHFAYTHTYTPMSHTLFKSKCIEYNYLHNYTISKKGEYNKKGENVVVYVFFSSVLVNNLLCFT